MSKVMQSARYAMRQLRNSPGFTAAAALTLALGIGAMTAIYSVLYATLLAPLPYPKPDQLVVVWSKIGGDRNVVSAGDFVEWKRRSTAFQELYASSGASFNLATAQEPEQVNGDRLTPGFYKMMGLNFLLGRDFLPEEGELGKEHVVILTHRLWERLGANRNIIGQQLRIDSEPYTVVGVLAPGPMDRGQVELAVPLAFKPEQINHDFHWLLVWGRMKPGISLANAQADMDLVTSRLARELPTSNKNWDASVEPLKNDFLPQDTQKTLWLLMGAVGFVLLIACVNVANLLLAKGTTRQKEVAVRTSLGAARGRIFGQFLTESLLLAVIAAVLGIGLSELLLKVVMMTMPPFTLPTEADVSLSLPVLFFTLAATMLCAALFGSVPAWEASRTDPIDALKEGGRAGTGVGRQRLRQALVVMEFALALTLLAGAGLAIRSFWKLTQVDLGIRTDHILTFALPLPIDGFTQPEKIVAFYHHVLEKLESTPGIVSAEAGTGMPLQGSGFGMGFTIAGQPPVSRSMRPDTPFKMVTPGYFQTYGIHMVQGRTLNDQDVAGGVRVAVVNENFARRYLQGLDPLKQRVQIDQLIPGMTGVGPTVEWQIVGVFHNVKTRVLRDDNSTEVIVPFWQSPWPQTQMAVRTTEDPDAMRRTIAAAINSVDPALPLANVATMEEVVANTRSADRFSALLYGSFAVVALLLAAIGIYSVMTFVVVQRTREIGLRVALGAGYNQILKLILREAAVLTAVGLALGLVGACLVGRTMTSTLYGVGTIDLWAFSAVSIVLFTAALVASYVPARRAAKVDPMVALRYE
ncbi:MAG TPA: ABC transporter permease [Terriglobales bacterium]